VIRNQAPVGKWDYQLKAVYFIAILDFVEFEEAEVKDTYMEQIYLYRKNAQKRLNNKLNMLFIELPKFTKTAEELTTNTERWIYLLKNLEKLKDLPPEVQGRIFRRLFERAQVKKLTKKEMEEYKTSILEYDSVKSAIAYSEKKAMEKGRQKERREMIKQFLRGGFSIEIISSVTGLSVEQIKNMAECQTDTD
jgi:predicted transposase/invertase (TIGR01784 family)